MSKCIICGRELTTGEPPEMYNNMCLKCYQEQNYAEYPFKQGVTDYQKQLKQSQTELAIRELEEKDNYHLRYELAGADETITNLKKQIEENGKEINTKNNKLAELKKELTICKDTLRRKTQSNRDLQHRVHNVNTQLAIQELEKVNGILTDTIIEVTQDEFDLNKLCYLEEISTNFYEKIQQQIKELKGE